MKLWLMKFLICNTLYLVIIWIYYRSQVKSALKFKVHKYIEKIVDASVAVTIVVVQGLVVVMLIWITMLGRGRIIGGERFLVDGNLGPTHLSARNRNQHV